MNSGKVLLGVLAGATAGAILGVLFAPHRGSVTRKKISRKGDYYADEVKEKIGELLDSMNERFEKLKGEISDFTDQKLTKKGEVK